jgi:hypothetical protein
MFLSVSKICIVLIFDSLVGSGSWELAVVSQEEVAAEAWWQSLQETLKYSLVITDEDSF